MSRPGRTLRPGRPRRVRLFVFGIPLLLGVSGLAYAYFTSQGGGAGAADNWIAGDSGHEHGDARSRNGHADLGGRAASGHGFGELLRDRQRRCPSRRNLRHLGITHRRNDVYRHRTFGR